MTTYITHPGSRGARHISPSCRSCCGSRNQDATMVTLAGLEPATSPRSPDWKQGRSVPLELQRHYDPYDRLWRRKGVQLQEGRFPPPCAIRGQWRWTGATLTPRFAETLSAAQ